MVVFRRQVDVDSNRIASGKCRQQANSSNQASSACTYPLREQAVEYALKVIADSGIKKVNLLGMENHSSSIAGKPDYANQLCVAVDSPYFWVLYEPCNLLHLQADYKQAFEVLADHIVHIHVKDGLWQDGESTLN